MKVKVLSLAVAAAALTAGGCSSSGSSSATNAASAPTSTSASKATGSPIYLSLIADIDDPAAGMSPKFGRPDLGAQAAIKAVNAAGGVNGHPLVLSVCDPKGNGNIANSCAQAAVASKSVADVGGSNASGTPVEIMNKAGLAMIGRLGGDPDEYSFPTVFPYFGPGPALSFGVVYAAAKFAHATKIAVMSTPPISDLYYGFAKTAAKAEGLTITETINVTPGSDLTAAVLKARSDGAQAIAVVSPIADQVIVAARQNGVTLPITTSLEPYQVQSIGGAGNGVYVVDTTQLPTTSQPGIVQMNNELDAYQSGIPRSSFTFGGWLSVHMFADVAKKLKTVTRQSVLAAFQHLTNQYAYDLIPPYTTTTRYTGLGGTYPDVYNESLYLQQIENGKLVSANGGAAFNPFPH